MISNKFAKDIFLSLGNVRHIFFVEDYQFIKFGKWVRKVMTAEQLLGAVLRIPSYRKVQANSTLLQFDDKITTPDVIDASLLDVIAFLEEGHKGCCGVLDIRYRQFDKDVAS